MWNEISTDDDVLKLMEAVCFFHDSCIKEISYAAELMLTLIFQCIR